MLKTLTLSLSLVVALGLCSVSKAGGLFHSESGCTTCGIASPQGPIVSPQAPAPSAQSECSYPVAKKCNLLEKCQGFGSKCAGLGNKMSCSIGDLCTKLKPKPPVYTYEWVLKKKRVWGCHSPCSSPACETCAVYPSSQGAPSPQAGPASPQASSPQAFGTYGSGQVTSYGSGQYAAAGSLTPAAAPAPAMLGGDEAPPAPAAPSMPPAAPAPAGLPSAPAAPTIPPVPPVPHTTGLLFSTPSGY